MDVSPRPLGPVLLAALLVACAAPAHAQAPPSAPQPTPPPSAPQPTPPPSAPQPTAPPVFHVGDHVEVSFLNSWYHATVLGIVGARWEISYDDYPADWNQLVGPERIRPVQPAPPPPPPAPPPGRTIAHLGRLGPGTRVLVEWHGTWYPARVLRALGDALVRIRYVGSGHEWDEAVDPARVRLPDKT